MTEKTSLIEFPCYFPIKIIGVHSEHFVNDITKIVLKHFPATSAEQINFNNSGKGNYTAVTAAVYTHNQVTLDDLYLELSRYPGIKMVL